MKHETETAQPAPLGQVERGVGRPAPERASACGLTECRDRPMCVRCARIADMDALCGLLPEGVNWGDPLTPEMLVELMAGGMTGDEACRFSVWWAHQRKTFTTPRQAAWAAWTEARSKTPNVRANRPSGAAQE